MGQFFFLSYRKKDVRETLLAFWKEHVPESTPVGFIGWYFHSESSKRLDRLVSSWFPHDLEDLEADELLSSNWKSSHPETMRICCRVQRQSVSLIGHSRAAINPEVYVGPLVANPALDFIRNASAVSWFPFLCPADASSGTFGVTKNPDADSTDGESSSGDDFLYNSKTPRAISEQAECRENGGPE